VGHDFKFKELDAEGLETLLAISKANRFNKWMFDTIQPYLKGNTLEIGSGIGNISHYFLKGNHSIALSDLRENYLGFLQKEFRGHPTLKGIYNIDLIDKDFDQKQNAQLNTFDSVFALNVIEHVQDDALALSNCKKLLKPGGTLLILVPAFQQLYNSLDRELFHFRRYTSTTLEEKIKQSGFTVSKSFYFNALGIPAWFWGGLVSKTISSTQMNAYNNLVPLARLYDRIVFNKLGLSVVCVAKNIV